MTLSTAIEDLARNALAEEFVFSFSTRESVAGEPVMVETRLGTVDTLRLVVSDQGGAVALWNKETETDVADLWSSSLDAEAGWQTPVLVENHSAAVSSPDMAALPDGALSVWLEGFTVEQRIWSNRYIIGEGWGDG